MFILKIYQIILVLMNKMYKDSEKNDGILKKIWGT